MKTFTQSIAMLLLFITLVFPLTSMAEADMSKSISADALAKMDKQERIVLDVRTVKEYQDGHVPGAINLPIADLPDLFSQLTDKDQKVVVYCRSGRRAGQAIDFLKEQGYTDLVHLEGDFPGWADAEHPVEKP